MRIDRRAFSVLALALGGVAALGALARPASVAGAPESSFPEPVPSAPAWRLDWARGAVVYQVFVRSFADGDGDGIGDFDGLIAKLDYLNDGKPKAGSDLEVDALWLMPVFPSPSYHGYDVTDYQAIQPAYGNLEGFRKLLAEAHRRGLEVILDLPLNHTSAQHPWFVAADSSPSDPKRDWYVWRGDDPGWVTPWGSGKPTWHPGKSGTYYGVFSAGMPDLNLRNAAVRAEAVRIARFWLELGVDGFRLDATRHLIEDGGGDLQVDTDETHAFLREFSAAVRQIAPAALLVGENWTDTARIARYFGRPAGDELPMNFDFPLAAAIVEAVKAGDRAPLVKTLEEVARTYPPGALDATFLTNHDMVRVATALGRDRGRLGSAAAVLLTLPGTPFLYYGEEVGLENGEGAKDEVKRTPMPWDGSPGGGFTTGRPWIDFAPGRATENVAAERAREDSLLATYRRLIQARHGSNSLRYGSLELLLPPKQPSSILSYIRRFGGAHVLVVHNLGAAAASAGPFYVGRKLEPIFTSPGVPAPAGGNRGFRVDLPPHASGVWRF